ncbi:MAG TPA: dTDP-4-dehydrorhamnose reductase [Dehalococcoidia bacterium]|nr:dTDP-4-dehydrorhamnose reductase [Dehalococcoidia bacterium]
MKLLVTGAHGQLGRALQTALGKHRVVAFSHSTLDVTDGPAVDAAITRQRPDVVLHCAALTDTARCEREPDLAMAVNGYGADKVARACARAGARLVAVSTNEVFDGDARTPYTEDAPTRPLNAYGVSKLEGERLTTIACPEAIIVRTSWVYGEGGNNFVEKVRNAAHAGDPLRFVTDEVAAPTAATELASAIAELLDRGPPAGVYHVAGEGAASRWDWAAEVLRLTGASSMPERVTTEELRAGGYSGPRKPPYSVLANTRARALGVVLRPWRDALAVYCARSQDAIHG